MRGGAPTGGAVSMQQVSRDADGSQPLRGWQRRAMVKYLATEPRDFLAVATPGHVAPRYPLFHPPHPQPSPQRDRVLPTPHHAAPDPAVPRSHEQERNPTFVDKDTHRGGAPKTGADPQGTTPALNPRRPR